MKPFELLAEAAINGARPKAVIEVGVQEIRKPGSIKGAVDEAVAVDVYQKTAAFRVRITAGNSKEATKIGRQLKRSSEATDVRVIPDRSSVMALIMAKSKGDAKKYVKAQVRQAGVSEAGDEKAMAKKMKAKGYTYIIILPKGQGKPLYTKSFNAAKEMAKEYGKGTRAMDLNKYLAGE